MRGGGIKRLDSLFTKYKNIKAPQSSVVKCFVEVVFDVVGIKLDQNNVTYTPSTRTIKLKVSGMIKSEIKLQEEAIILHLKGRLGVANAPKLII